MDRIKEESLVFLPGREVAFPPGLTVSLTPEYLFVQAEEPLLAASSAIVGGGLGRRRFFVNREVGRDYRATDPVAELTTFLAKNFPGPAGVAAAGAGSWVALMTAARVADVAGVSLYTSDLAVTVLVTAGVNNACAAGITPVCSPTAVGLPGTINIMAFSSLALTPGALINAVQTVTEAKTRVLRELKVTCPLTGMPATGTNTDAVLIGARYGRPGYPYAGPGTVIGYLLALGVHRALVPALQRYWERSGK
ncbi:MAG: adenosylcobinamide amidohydrolase [Heliobacteriaceae bacterium]|nr:adenosylcobinamide amidohydrolase [Heliobacteriaceae bacterium]